MKVKYFRQMTTLHTYFGQLPIQFDEIFSQNRKLIFSRQMTTLYVYFEQVPMQFDENFQIFCQTNFSVNSLLFCSLYELVKRMMQNTTSIE